MSAPFDPSFYPERVLLVGAGGTGAQWARSIARMLYDKQARNQSVPSFTIIDPDVIEEKNVGRQLFTSGSVGRFKAETLARSFSLALGIEIGWINEPFDAKRMVGNTRRPTLICGAVDNHLARREMARCGYGKQAQNLWIDTGNHRSTGQVIIGNTTHPKDVQIGKQFRSEEAIWQWLPVASLLFPQLLEPEAQPAPVTDASCAEAVSSGDQHLLVNDLISTVASAYTYKILYRQPITSFISYIDVEMMSAHSLEISREGLDAYLTESAEAEQPKPIPQAHSPYTVPVYDDMDLMREAERNQRRADRDDDYGL